VTHALPTKAQPCPLKDGIRESNGWVFYYKDWKMMDSWKSNVGPFEGVNKMKLPVYRDGAGTTKEMLPESRNILIMRY
jgi:hypothetical protein